MVPKDVQMEKREIISQISDTVGFELISEISSWFDTEEREFKENITLRDRVEWLEKQLKDIREILDKKQPDYSFEQFQQEILNEFPDQPELWVDANDKAEYSTPTLEEVKNNVVNEARRNKYYDSLRSRDKSVFSVKEDF